MNRTKSDQADCMVLQIEVATAVTLASHLGASPQAADHQQREQRETEDARNDRNDDRFG